MNLLPGEVHAAAWVMAVDGRLPRDGARLYGVDTHKVEVALGRAKVAIRFMNQMPSLAEKARVALREDDTLTGAQLGKIIGVHATPAKQYIHAVQCEMLIQAFAGQAQGAMPAETIGGEHGAHVAAAIRGLV